MTTFSVTGGSNRKENEWLARKILIKMFITILVNRSSRFGFSHRREWEWGRGGGGGYFLKFDA